jgi:hypothetical protein
MDTARASMRSTRSRVRLKGPRSDSIRNTASALVRGGVVEWAAVDVDAGPINHLPPVAGAQVEQVRRSERVEDGIDAFGVDDAGQLEVLQDGGVLFRQRLLGQEAGGCVRRNDVELRVPRRELLHEHLQGLGAEPLGSRIHGGWHHGEHRGVHGCSRPDRLVHREVDGRRTARSEGTEERE